MGIGFRKGSIVCRSWLPLHRVCLLPNSSSPVSAYCIAEQEREREKHSRCQRDDCKGSKRVNHGIMKWLVLTLHPHVPRWSTSLHIISYRLKRSSSATCTHVRRHDVGVNHVSWGSLTATNSFITTKRYGKTNKWRHKTKRRPHKF